MAPPPKTGPRIYGLAPSEVKDGEEVYIGGRDFLNYPTLTVTLTDSVTGVVYPVPINWVENNRMKVRPPKPTGLSGRKLFYLRVNENNIVWPAAERLYVRDSNNSQLPGEHIHMAFVRWKPAWICEFQNNLPGGHTVRPTTVDAHLSLTCSPRLSLVGFPAITRGTHGMRQRG